jgi:hypothetical protein
MNRLYLACVAVLVALAGIPSAGCGDDEGPIVASPDGGAAGGPNADASLPTADGGGGQALGRACATDAECGVLTCVRPIDDLSWGFGPPNGICSRPCDADSVCAPYGGLCIGFDSTVARGWCVEACTPGGSASAENKCHGRTDEACAQVDVSAYACVPACVEDADCGTRTCDHATGFCAQTVSAAPAVGTPCDPKADPDSCAPGFCQAISATDSGQQFGFCTMPCRLGGLEGCGYTRNAVAAAIGVVAACYGAYTGLDGNGDQGFCWQLCDVKSECLDSTAVCDDAARRNLSHGTCEPTGPSVGDAGGAQVPDAGTDAQLDAAPDAAPDVAPDAAPDVAPNAEDAGGQ